MGGDLARAPAGKAPTFIVAALRDPIGANLDRIQIVKGWLDAKGELHEKSTTSLGRQASPRGWQAAVGGSTVDVANCDVDQHRSAHRLIAVWKDPASTPPNGLSTTPRHRDPDAALDRLRREALRVTPLPGTR
jgi:hypothetical protein